MTIENKNSIIVLFQKMKEGPWLGLAAVKTHSTSREWAMQTHQQTIEAYLQPWNQDLEFHVLPMEYKEMISRSIKPINSTILNKFNKEAEKSQSINFQLMVALPMKVIQRSKTLLLIV